MADKESNASLVINLPEFFINTHNKPRAGPGTWEVPNNIREMCEFVGRTLKFQKTEDWYGIKNDHFDRNHAAGLLRKFRGSASLLIFKTFPEKNLNIWKFARAPTLQKTSEQAQDEYYVSFDTQKEHFISLVRSMLEEYRKKHHRDPTRDWWSKTKNPDVIGLSKILKKKGAIDFTWGNLLKSLEASRYDQQYVCKTDGLLKFRMAIENTDKVIETLKKILNEQGMPALSLKNLNRFHSEDFSKLGAGISRVLKPKDFEYRYKYSSSYDMPDEFICLHLLKDKISEEEFVRFCKNVNPYCCDREELIELHAEPAYEKITRTQKNISLFTYELFATVGCSGVATRAKELGINIDDLRQRLGLSRGRKCITYDNKIVHSAGECYFYQFVSTYSRKAIKISVQVKYVDIDPDLAKQLGMCRYSIDFVIKVEDLLIFVELWGYWKDTDRVRNPEYLMRKDDKLLFTQEYKQKHPDANAVFIGINNEFGILKDYEFDANIIRALSPYMDFDMSKKPNRSQLLTIEKSKEVLLREGKLLQSRNGGILPPVRNGGDQDVRNLYQKINNSSLFKTEDQRSNWDNYKKELGEEVPPTGDEIKRSVIDFINQSQTNEITLSYIQSKLDGKYTNLGESWYGRNFVSFLEETKEFAKENGIAFNKDFRMKIDKIYKYPIEKYIEFGKEFLMSMNGSSRNSIIQEDWKKWRDEERKKGKRISERPWRGKNCKWNCFEEFIGEVYEKNPDLKRVQVGGHVV